MSTNRSRLRPNICYSLRFSLRCPESPRCSSQNECRVRPPHTWCGNSSHCLRNSSFTVRSLLVEREKEMRSDRRYRNVLASHSKKKMRLRVFVVMHISTAIRKIFHSNSLRKYRPAKTAELRKKKRVSQRGLSSDSFSAQVAKEFAFESSNEAIHVHGNARKMIHRRRISIVPTADFQFQRPSLILVRRKRFRFWSPESQ